MAKVYIFNPQAQTGITVLSLFVNGDPTAYQIRFTSKGLDFTPFSTAGERSTGKSGNRWAPDNSVLVQAVPPPLDYRVDLPLPVTMDLILYVFFNKMALIGINGSFLKFYQPKAGAQEAVLPQSREKVAAEANGRVYVFNLFNEGMELSTNSFGAGRLPGWSQGGTGQPPIFTPGVLKVDRVLNRSEAPGHFVNGSNSVSTLWDDSGTGSFPLAIDGNLFPISQDLLLFILRDRWLLVNQFGVQQSDGPIQLAGSTHATRHD